MVTFSGTEKSTELESAVGAFMKEGLRKVTKPGCAIAQVKVHPVAKVGKAGLS